MMRSKLSENCNWQPVYDCVMAQPASASRQMLDEFNMRASLPENTGRYNHIILLEILEQYRSPYGRHILSQAADEYDEAIKAQEIFDGL